MKNYSFRTIIQKDGKQYRGFVPALPGCHTFGKNIEETRKFLNEAIEGYILSCLDHNDPIPEDNGFQSIEHISLPITALKGKKAYA